MIGILLILLILSGIFAISGLIALAAGIALAPFLLGGFFVLLLASILVHILTPKTPPHI
jgi:hypothetical protein